MNTSSKNSPPFLESTIELSLSGKQLRKNLTIPNRPVSLLELLPLFQSLANSFVDVGIELAEDKGEKISCRAGCGACCRQYVPITELEVERLRELVNNMPEPRRKKILDRFAAAKSRLQEAGLLDKLAKISKISKAERVELGLAYFKLGIACPFLEDESCSIHPNRPISCREYLVTSPAENCAQPTEDTIECVEMPAKVSNVVAKLDARERKKPLRWVPLTLALEWAETHSYKAPKRLGTELVQQFFSALAGKAK